MTTNDEPEITLEGLADEPSGDKLMQAVVMTAGSGTKMLELTRSGSARKGIKTWVESEPVLWLTTRRLLTLATAFALVAQGCVTGHRLHHHEKAADSYQASGQRVAVDIALDRIGIVIQDDVDAKQLEPLAEARGLRQVRRIPPNFLIFQLPEPVGRAEVARIARSLKQESRYGRLMREIGVIITDEQDPDTPILLTDEFIALFKSEVTRQQIDDLNREHGVEVVGPDPFVENQFLLRVTDASGGDSLTVSRIYERSPLTEFAHPNFWTLDVRMDTVPTDPLFANQWHHRNTGQSGGLADADADTSWAWDFGNGSPGVLIAVIDDGFDLTHEDLAPNLFTNPGEVAGNGVDDEGNGFVDDVNGWDFAPCGGGTPAPGCGDNNPGPGGAGDNHGTAVAGSAMARGGNSLGVVGSCPNCRLLPIRRGYGMFSEQAKANAFGYAQAMGADVINNSWGHVSTAGTVTTVVANAINAANAAGSVVVFAAGNRNSSGWCASSYPSLASVLAVSSATNRDLKVTEAAFGNCVDVLAPSHRGYSAPYNGTLNTTTTDRTGAAGYNNDSPSTTPCPSAEPGLNYTNCFGGTSFAAPLTAGVVGLLRSADGTLTPNEIQRLIQDTADKINPGVAAYADATGFSTPASGVATHSWGRLNALEAVRIAAPVADDGKGGVDVFLRDNRLDWGNTSGYLGQQPSNTLFESPRGYIGHYRSEDIKVDAPPLHAALTAANWDSWADETPSAVAGDVNRVYVRVHNRGPDPATSVSVKLHWAQFGTALPALPADFWTAFPADSAAPSNPWQAMTCTGIASTVCSLASVAYSGSSVAGTAADAAQVVSFDFPAPPVDSSLANHFCLLAMAEAANDAIDPSSKSLLVVDTITPNDNNVTHRNYHDLITEEGDFDTRFFVRNPFREPIRTAVRLEGLQTMPRSWRVELDRYEWGEVFSLAPGEEVLVTLHISVPPGTEGEVEVVQVRLDEQPETVMGGFTVGLRSRSDEPKKKEKKPYGQSRYGSHLEQR